MRTQSKFGLTNSIVKFGQPVYPFREPLGHDITINVKGIVNEERMRWHSIKEAHDGFLFEQPERANERFPEKYCQLAVFIIALCHPGAFSWFTTLRR